MHSATALGRIISNCLAMRQSALSTHPISEMGAAQSMVRLPYLPSSLLNGKLKMPSHSGNYGADPDYVRSIFRTVARGPKDLKHEEVRGPFV
jgi:hypothetical protein